jgi:hypothetical protein
VWEIKQALLNEQVEDEHSNYIQTKLGKEGRQEKVKNMFLLPCFYRIKKMEEDKELVVKPFL